MAQSHTMVSSSVSLCCLFLLGAVYLTTVSPAPVEYDGDITDSDIVSTLLDYEATVQQSTCCNCYCPWYDTLPHLRYCKYCSPCPVC